MSRVTLSISLVLCLCLPVYALDDTDESWRKMDPALGIEVSIQARVPNPPISNTSFSGNKEKEFILYELESEVCNASFEGYCFWRGSNKWKRVVSITNRGGEVTSKGDVSCPARVILTSWYKNDAQAWVQAKTNIIRYIPYKPSIPPEVKSTGVVAGFVDDGGGYGTVEFVYGCNP